MRRNIKVYVAGPYSADNVISVLENIKNGIRVSVEVFLAGYSPFCPFIDYQFQFFLREGERLDVDDYYGYSLAWLTFGINCQRFSGQI